MGMGTLVVLLLAVLIVRAWLKYVKVMDLIIFTIALMALTIARPNVLGWLTRVTHWIATWGGEIGVLIG
jgi:hypothetical protein